MELTEFLQTIKTAPDPKNGEPEIPPSEPKKDSLPAPETPEGEKSFRSLVEELLADGPQPYEKVLTAVGGNEDILREAIRGWKELIAYDSGEEWFWELQPATATIANFATDPVSIGERIGIKY